MKRIKTLILIIMSIFGITGCGSTASAEGYTDMDVEEFNKYIHLPDVQLVDVRTPEEYSEGHIEGAINIDYYDPAFASMFEKELDKTKPVAVYCRSGHRSGLAAKVMTEAGYRVTNLEGGIIAWKKDGMGSKTPSQKI